MDNIFDSEDSLIGPILASKRFNQKWSTSKQTIVSVHDILEKRGTRSVTRQRMAKAQSISKMQ